MPIRTRLYEWFRENARDLPWRHTRDPYRIWLSEIILQQTRVEQGLPYYERFVSAFPDVGALASAPVDRILRLWEGLGYYRRALNMHRAARYIVEERRGIFPGSYAECLQLPGVGPYTAAAIASFAYAEPVAVLDGNVMRVLARFHGFDRPVNTGAGRKSLQALADDFLDPSDPALHNQAMMELGALVCLPRRPQCEVCPLAGACVARAEGRTAELPVKKPRKPVQDRYMDYLVSIRENRISVAQRTGSDIWKNLYEFPLVEGIASAGEARQALTGKFRLPEPPRLAAETQHVLTHRRLHIRFWLTGHRMDFPYVNMARLDRYSFPVVLRRFLAGIKNNGNFE